jgi:hypothetical protein
MWTPYAHPSGQPSGTRSRRAQRATVLIAFDGRPAARSAVREAGTLLVPGDGGPGRHHIHTYDHGGA